MTTEEIINLILCILSFLLAAISVVTVILTLKQNNKMLEANVRPYVVVYLVYEEFCSQTYLFVKNFGDTSAIINEINLEPSIHLYKKTSNEILKETMIAPKQQFHFLALSDNHQERFDKSYMGTVNIKYMDCVTNKKYSDSYKISLEYSKEILSINSSNSGFNKMENSLRNIEKILAFLKNKDM